MWLIYAVLVLCVIGAHVLMFFVIKSGIKAAEKAIQRDSESGTLNRSHKHWIEGFRQPFQF